MALSDGDKAIIAALEVLRGNIVQLPLAIAQNAAQAEADRSYREPAARSPAPTLVQRGLTGIASAANMLVGTFGRLLGPLASFGSLLAAPTSGMSVLTKSMGLLSAAIAPALLPVLFTLATGIAATSDVVFHRLLPAFDSWSRLVIQTGVPAVVQLADAASAAADVLNELPNLPGIRQLIEMAKMARRFDEQTGGMLSAAVNPLGTIAKSEAGLSAVMPGRTIAKSQTGIDLALPGLGIGRRLLSGESPTADALFPAFGLGRRALGFGGGGGGGASPDAQAAADRAKLDTLRELQMSMLPRVQVGGGAASVWSRSQQAALGASPYERRMQEMLSEVITIMTKASERDGGTGTLTDAERRRVDGLREGMRRPRGS